ncbi:MAG: hypothetical protein AB7F75_11045 [Planctomycetota bacterium]
MALRFLTPFFIVLVLTMAGGHVRAEEDEGRTEVKSLMVNEEFIDTPIQEVVDRIAEATGKTVTLGKNVSGNVTVKINNLYWTKALRVVARKIDAFVMENGQDWVELTRPPLVTFATDPQGTDIRAVLDAIAVNYGFNLVMSSSISGTVHLRLNRVPWRHAVEVAVKAAGQFAVVEEDFDILRIVPVADLATQLETRVFPLKYITSPSSVQATMETSYAQIQAPSAEFVLQRALSRVITPNLGFLEFDPDNRAFIVKDTPPVLKEVEGIIEMLDHVRPQVLVEVYVISTSKTNFVDFGVDWSDTGPLVSLSGGSMLHRLPFQIGSGGFEDAIGIPATDPPSDTVVGGVAAHKGGRVGLPLASSWSNISDGTFTAGSLDFSTVTAVLKFVERDSESRVVQSPKLSVLDNQRATIFSGEEVRYAESSQVSAQDGSLNLQFSEASGSPVNVGFQLFLTPHVVPGTNKVILDVIPQSDILTGTTSSLPGFDTYGSGASAIDLPRRSSQTVVTQVQVESGQSAMIGGLVSYNDSSSDTRIPFLGDIPIINFFFRNKSRTKDLTNLTIFIRPTIVQDEESSRQALLEDLRRRERRALRDFKVRAEKGGEGAGAEPKE